MPPDVLPPPQPPSPQPETGAGTGGGTPTCGEGGRGVDVTGPVDSIRYGLVAGRTGLASRGGDGSLRTLCGTARSTGTLARRVGAVPVGRSRVAHAWWWPVWPPWSYGKAVASRRPDGLIGRRVAMRGRATRCGTFRVRMARAVGVTGARWLAADRPGRALWVRLFACEARVSARASAPAWDSASTAKNARTRPNTVSSRRRACRNAGRSREVHKAGRSRSAGSVRAPACRADSPDPSDAAAPGAVADGAGRSRQAVVRGALRGDPGQRTLSAISRPPPTFGLTSTLPPRM
ncbi:hypothetical protein Airi02_060830 [Actinoallomurus iriomotensis]|uniref:Uncharacterized protein n=1 Tax=Actinoallomurus iriomotensis TaxID=478107 RepID=A0A9W6S6U9_9ACTN|nr:hypothetical protein Airi02_060830 [Actinoallomurus iriomotensis]